METGEEQGGEAYEVAGVFGIGAEFGGEADEAGLEEFLELRRDGVGAREGSVADAVAGGILLASGRDGSARLGAIGAGGGDLLVGTHGSPWLEGIMGRGGELAGWMGKYFKMRGMGSFEAR